MDQILGIVAKADPDCELKRVMDEANQCFLKDKYLHEPTYPPRNQQVRGAVSRTNIDYRGAAAMMASGWKVLRPAETWTSIWIPLSTQA
jgi:hypothetical protein